ncbi:MAG: glycosyltransferase family 4 protein [Bacteroidota bacterium]|nr:glycosyltransferase family 4 protein [Bacteroidota bacterium]
MKKVLVITYYWPPSGGAGVQRWLKFIKYFRDFGWEPIVYTPSNPEFPDSDNSLLNDIPDGIEIIRHKIWEPYQVYKKFSGKKKEDKIQAAFLSEKRTNPITESISVWIRGNLFIPDARKFWIKPSVRFLKKKLAGKNIDLIISSGPPHTTHRIALKISRYLGKPWLADFRDPWTGIDFYKDLKLTRWADRKHHRMEREVLRKAEAVTVISPTMAEDFNKIYPRKYEVITNGYDPEDISISETPEPDEKFSLAYIGTLTATRNLPVLWNVLGKLVRENKELEKDLVIRLVGKVDFNATQSIRDAGLETFVSRTEYLPHNEVIKIQQQSSVLLLLINNTPNARCILTGKFFEYMGSRRPILCIGPENGDAAAILSQTGAGLTSGFEDEEKLKENILQYYRLFKVHRLVSLSSGVESFSRKNLTGKMASVMDAITR